MIDYLIISSLFFSASCILAGYSLAAYITFRVAMEIRKRKKGCEWSSINDMLDQEYKTSCGKVFYDATESGEHVTDWIKYCPYCSEEVKKPSK